VWTFDPVARARATTAAGNSYSSSNKDGDRGSGKAGASASASASAVVAVAAAATAAAVAVAGTRFGVVPRYSIKYVCVLLLLLLLRGFRIPLLRRRRRHLISLDRCVSNSLSNQASSSRSRVRPSLSLRLFNVSVVPDLFVR